jgi:putative endonuclease
VSVKSSRDKGITGEKTARKYLKKHGLKIIEVNFRVKLGEIDIIAREKDTLVFVEVKSAMNTSFGNPLDWIPLWKQRRIIRVSQLYMLNKGLHDKTQVRYDVVGVDPDRNVCHVRDAFRPDNAVFV